MNNEAFSHSEHNPDERRRRLKRLVDQLVTLAPFGDEPTVADHAADIIQEMKEASTPSRQLTQLEELAVLSSSNPDELALHELIDDTAEYLVNEIERCSPEETKNIDNLHNVWAAIKAWDVARMPFTERLCIKLLRNFQGSGQPQLASAFGIARSSNIPFQEALTAVNYEATLYVA